MMAGFNNFQNGFGNSSPQSGPDIGQLQQHGGNLGQNWASGMRNIFGSPFGQQGGFGSFGQQGGFGRFGQQGGFGGFGQQSGFNPFGGGQQNPWGNFGGQFGGWGGGQQNPWGQMFGSPYGGQNNDLLHRQDNNIGQQPGGQLAFGNGTQFGGQTNTVGTVGLQQRSASMTPQQAEMSRQNAAQLRADLISGAKVGGEADYGSPNYDPAYALKFDTTTNRYVSPLIQQHNDQIGQQQ